MLKLVEGDVLLYMSSTPRGDWIEPRAQHWDKEKPTDQAPLCSQRCMVIENVPSGRNIEARVSSGVWIWNMDLSREDLRKSDCTAIKGVFRVHIINTGKVEWRIVYSDRMSGSQ